MLVRFTGRAEGDLGHRGRWVAVAGVDPAVEARRRQVVDRPWSWARQVHGAGVVTVEGPGGGAGQPGDALVTTSRRAALAVLTADCAPVALASGGGAYGVVHAGWRGLVAGVVERAVAALRAVGGGPVEAALGPCIHPGCYEFGETELAQVASRWGQAVRARTAAGEPALDLPTAVRVALGDAGVEIVHHQDVCTACCPGWFSHRGRGEVERQAVVAWAP